MQNCAKLSFFVDNRDVYSKPGPRIQISSKVILRNLHLPKTWFGIWFFSPKKWVFLKKTLVILKKTIKTWFFSNFGMVFSKKSSNFFKNFCRPLKHDPERVGRWEWCLPPFQSPLNRKNEKI